MVSSSEIKPRSTHCSTAMVVIILVQEAMTSSLLNLTVWASGWTEA
jgi:hypothetical protein